MGTGQKRNTPVIQQAYKALDQFKYEIANEIGIDQNQIYGGYWGNLTSRDCGAVGGNMVRRMIEAAEQTLAEQTMGAVRQGFQSALNVGSNNPKVNFGSTSQSFGNTSQNFGSAGPSDSGPNRYV